MFTSLRQFFCFHHTGPFTLKNPTGNHKYDTYGGPMDEYKTMCEKCGKDIYFFF